MNAQEFRLGCLYKYRIEDAMDPRVSWWEVCQMDVESLKWVSEHPEDDYYSPIYLTDEWFIKLGFGRVEKTNTWRSENLHLSGFEFKGNQFVVKFSAGYFILTINYVHQLQNLHHILTGKEIPLNPSVFESSVLARIREKIETSNLNRKKDV